MHEIGVVRQVLRTVENFAKENGLDRIDTIVLEIGDLSLVIPKYVEDIYNVIIKDTPFEFTKLKIEVVEGQGVCRDCKRAPERRTVCAVFSFVVRQTCMLLSGIPA